MDTPHRHVASHGHDFTARVEANFIETWWALAGAGGEQHDEHDLRWFAAGDHPILNAVIDTRLQPHAAPARIAETAEALLARGGSAVWWVLPGSQPHDLAGELLSAGFAPWGEPWPGMAVLLDALVEPSGVAGVELLRVRDEATLDEYLSVFDSTLSPGPAFTSAMRRWALKDGFGFDAMGEHFVARDGARPVACASLVIAGESAGLYNVATVEDARRRGIGAWISATALTEGRRRGLELGVLQASALGYRVYERLGFRAVCSLAPYIRRAP